ncbi:MAG: hypothetical protein WDM90_02300 [Ferruginibacter sp.]
MPDKRKEENAIRNINDWLEPLIPEIVDNDVTAILYIDEVGIQHLSFSNNVSNDLINKAQKELEKYQYRLRHQSNS